METDQQDELLFPEGLINWSGPKKGGVRQPFKSDTGRPVNEQFITPLVEKLSNWVSSIIAGKSGTPTAVLLVGGPGNGKTDAVEGAIATFDRLLSADGKLLSKFSEQYNNPLGALPPRRTEVEFSGIVPNESGMLPVIRLVQDATEKTSTNPNDTAESLLLDELREILHGKYNGIYIGCVNRGILANTTALAREQGDTEMAVFMARIVSAASGGVDTTPCWPLQESKIALWPMDVESLVAPRNSKELKTVAEQVFEKALADDKWRPPCSNKSDCPFCQNKILLSNDKSREHLINFLYCYELASGKRWTFRDIYSLVAYLLIGEPGSLKIEGKTYSPCDWTAKMLQISEKGAKFFETARARYLLASKLYSHRLFSNWPSLNSGKHLDAFKAVFPREAIIPENIVEKKYFTAKHHFGALKTLAQKEHNAISELLSGDFTQYLDPALLSGELEMYTEAKDRRVISINDIDEHFSLSIADGLKLVSSRINPIERKLLEQLSLADDALMDQYHPAKLAKQVRLLQSSLRQFAVRFAKRSLGLKYGISKDAQLFKEYAFICQDDSQHEAIEDLVEQLVNEERRFFKIPLSTTFGQPVAHWDREVSLRVRSVKTSMKMFLGDETRPANRFPFILVHNRYVPVTFVLFKALKELEDGLDPASLPQEVFALIDEIKSVTAGQVARDRNFVDGHVELTIGQQTYALKVSDTIRFRN